MLRKLSKVDLSQERSQVESQIRSVVNEDDKLRLAQARVAQVNDQM